MDGRGIDARRGPRPLAKSGAKAYCRGMTLMDRIKKLLGMGKKAA